MFYALSLMGIAVGFSETLDTEVSLLAVFFKEGIMPSFFALDFLKVHSHSDFLRRSPIAILEKVPFIRLSAGSIVLSFIPHLFCGKHVYLTC